MPYSTLKALPKSVRDNLPKHAQETYQASFINAWDEYDHDEARAHRVAWGAVEQKYEKEEDTGRWKQKKG